MHMLNNPTLQGVLYSADWTRGLDSRQCADKTSDCKIQVIMMTVINGLARQD